MTGEGGVTPNAANQGWLLSGKEGSTWSLKRVHQLESHKAINYIIVLVVIKPANFFFAIHILDADNSLKKKISLG